MTGRVLPYGRDISRHCEERELRSNPDCFHSEERLDCFASLAMTGMALLHYRDISRHCEERELRSNPDCVSGQNTGLLRFARNDGAIASFRLQRRGEGVASAAI
jgi:hypothetical protein